MEYFINKKARLLIQIKNCNTLDVFAVQYPHKEWKLFTNIDQYNQKLIKEKAIIGIDFELI